MKPDEPHTYEYQGWHVICTPLPCGWWRLRGECFRQEPPLRAVIYDDCLTAAVDRLTVHINDTEDVLCQSA